MINPIGLIYHFGRFKFEFNYVENTVYITDEFYQRKWKFSFTHNIENPFQFELVEKKLIEPRTAAGSLD